MNDNPYHAPQFDEALDARNVERSGNRCHTCPECGAIMESGYIASSSSLFWCRWTNLKWLLRGNEALAKTSSVFGINKLSGFRCVDCEIVLFAYGKLRGRFSPDRKQN